MLKSDISCIICDKSFSEVTPSREHIIPNALGGRLVTMSATCVKCNSDSGHEGNSYLVNKFQLLANSLDVIRDRGDHPVARFVDPTNDIEYRLKPSKAPIKAPNIKVNRLGSSINIEFSAPNREEAEHILKHLKPDKWQYPPILEFTEIPSSQFTMNMGYSTDDDNLLREIARIAVCYARHVGCAINATEPTLRFSRGEDINYCPVVPVQGNVVSINDLPNHPLYHGIFLNKPEDSSVIQIYVFLFQYCEFLVEFQADYWGPNISSGYLLNLVSGISENRAFKWKLKPDVSGIWFNERKVESSHFAERFKSVQYYLNQRDRLWIDRALLIGVNHYFQILESGSTKKKATNEAWKEANRILKRYEMKIDKFTIN